MSMRIRGWLLYVLEILNPNREECIDYEYLSDHYGRWKHNEDVRIISCSRKKCRARKPLPPKNIMKLE